MKVEEKFTFENIDVVLEHETKNNKIEKRIQEMKREKRRQELLRKLGIPVVCCILLFSVVTISVLVNKHKDKNPISKTEQHVVQETPEQNDYVEENHFEEERQVSATPWEYEYKEEVIAKPEVTEFHPIKDENVNGFSDEIISQYGVFIDVENEKIIAQKEAYTKMYPASMTKIMTILVAAEKIEKSQLKDTFTITREITDYSFENDCSCVGFDVDETVSVEDLFYGTILPSGADAALGLAYYVAGTHENFVELMNNKLKQLGISQTTHFTNCVGIYNDEHFSTAYDMAIILKAASENELCRKVLSAHTYTTSVTEQHPDGIIISNWFLRRIEDKDTHGEVLCGKTGYVRQSGNCSASLAINKNGNEYICVTAMSSSVWNCIKDQTALYSRYMEE